MGPLESSHRCGSQMVNGLFLAGKMRALDVPQALDIPKSGSLRFAPRRDFKGDYCDLEPLVGAKQLLRTIEGVAQVSFFRREKR